MNLLDLAYTETFETAMPIKRISKSLVARRSAKSALSNIQANIQSSIQNADAFVMADGSIGKLNSGQVAALLDAGQVRNPMSEFKELLIVGPAGTGKSTIVRELLRRWRYIYGEGNVILSSPTHRANWVLKSMSEYKVRRFGVDIKQQEDPLTLEALMGARQNELTGRFVYPTIEAASKMSKPPPIVKIGRRSAIIVDEASMMDYNELKRIRQWREYLGFGIIFIGDIEQLPPVGMEKSPVFSASIREVCLTEVMRQRGGNPLLDLVTDIRLGNNPPVVANLNSKTGEGIVLASNRAAVLQSVTSLSAPEIVRENMNQLRVLAGRNRTVREWNGLIHNMMFPSATSPVCVGEVVIGYRSTDTMHNGVEYLVADVSSFQDFCHKSSGFTAKGWHISLSSDPEKGAEVRVFIVSRQDESRYAQQFHILSDRKQAAWQVWHDSGRDKSKIMPAIMATKALESFTGEVGMMNDISPEGDVENLEESEKSPLRRMFDLGYASTVHKAQGGTVNVVVVDMGDMTSFPGDPVFKRRLVYTALSRASKAAIVMGPSFKTSEDHLDKLVDIGTTSSFYAAPNPTFIVEDASLYGKGVVPPAGQGVISIYKSR